MDKSVGKKLKTPHFNPKNTHKHTHGQKNPNKRPRPAAEGAKKRRIATSPRVDDIRLILESTATDDELALKIDHVKTELRAVDGALGDEGPSYLGIIDKAKLEKRRQLLEKRHQLLKEEREVLQTLRVQLAEEERTGTERIELRAPSSPTPRRSSSSCSSNGNAVAAALPQRSSPSLRIQNPAAATSSPATKHKFAYPPLSPPAAARVGASRIGEFLKINSAAMGKKAAAKGRSDAAAHDSHVDKV